MKIQMLSTMGNGVGFRLINIIPNGVQLFEKRSGGGFFVVHSFDDMMT